MSSDLEYARDLDYEPDPDSYSEIVSDIDAANGGPIDQLEVDDELTVQPCTCRIAPSSLGGTRETDWRRHEINCSWRKQEERMWSRKQTTTNARQVINLERARIRTELLDWLVGTILPCDAGLVNGRRIVDEIDRICPKE